MYMYVPWSCIFRNWSQLGLIMYILTTLEFPKNNFEFHLCMYVYVCMYVCMYVCVCVYVYMCMYMYVYF